MQVTTEKCFLNVEDQTKRAFRVDIIDDYKKAIYDNDKKCYVTEDWDIIPRRDFYPDNLVSIYYLKTLINFDDTWESDLPVFQAEFPIYTHAKE